MLWRLLRVLWTARRSNQSILKEISPEYSLEGLMLKLKLQYFGHLMWKIDSLEEIRSWERLKAVGKGDDRGWDGWMTSPTWWHEFEEASGVGDGQGGLACCGHGIAKSWTWLSNWTELNWFSGEKILAKSIPGRKEIQSQSGNWEAVPMPYLKNFPKGLIFDRIKIIWKKIVFTLLHSLRGSRNIMKPFSICRLSILLWRF